MSWSVCTVLSGGETKNSSGTCLNFLLQLLLFTVSGIKVDFISLSEIFSRQLMKRLPHSVPPLDAMFKPRGEELMLFKLFDFDFVDPQLVTWHSNTDLISKSRN